MSSQTLQSDSPTSRSALRRLWVAPVLLFLVTVSVYGVTANRESASVDTHAASAEAWRIASVGSPWLEDVMDDRLGRNPFLREASNGHVVAMRTAGPVIVTVPFYWVLGRGQTADEFGFGPGGVAAATLTAGTVVLVFLALTGLVRRRLALGASLVFAFATPTWSVSADAPWTHTVTQLALAGAAYAMSRDRWWLSGACLSLGIFARPHVALIAAAVGLGVGLSRRSLRIVLSTGLASALGLGLLVLWNHWMFGGWSVGGAYRGRVDAAMAGYNGGPEFASPHAQLLNYLGFLVAPDRGVLVWSPVLLLLVPAIVRCWRTCPDWTRWLAVGGVVYTFFQLRLNYFVGGDFFYGYRHGLELVTCLVPIAAVAYQRSSRRFQLAVCVLATVQLAAISLGAVTNGFALPLEYAWKDNEFWVALRLNPAVVLVWSALCGAIVVVAMRVLRAPHDQTAAGGQTRV